MKLKYSTIALALGALMSACNMDLEPAGYIVDTNGLENYNDVYGFRNSLYITARSLTTGGSDGSFFTIPDIQADMFNGIIRNGNRLGVFANGTFNSSTSEIEDYYSGLFTYINYANYLITNGQKVYDLYVEANEPETAELIKSYIAEAHFFRGFYYACMFDRYCPLYTEARADQNYGVCIVTEYNPTADRSKYPGRSTMRESIEFIQSELNLALEGLLEYEEAGNKDNLTYMAEYISSNAVKAVQARFALWIGDYQTALTKSQEVIKTGLYPLAGSSTANSGGSWKKVCEEYTKMWTDDTGTEIIFMPYETTNELGGSTGLAWISTDINSADYIPTPNCVDMYAGGNNLTGYTDARRSAFISSRSIDSAFGKTNTPTFNKYPGNPALQTSTALNIKNKAKPFRTSELYLIGAEAAVALNQMSVANDLMNTFMKYRINKYEAQNLGSADMTSLIREQRAKELIGEGFRLSDLRRWGMSFNRADQGSYSNDEVNSLLVTAGLQVVYTNDDPRYTWPIPASEFTMNPQMKLQNPGY